MKTITTLLAIIFLTSCSQVEKRGYSFELSDYQNLREGMSDKNNTLDAMGYPTISSVSNDGEFWIYYSEDVKKLLFFKPEILDRKIITIAFDNKQNIKKINSYSLKDQNSITFNSDYTEVENTKVSWWKEIFGNIGQVRANSN